jgi:RHS repeat-associated protein
LSGCTELVDQVLGLDLAVLTRRWLRPRIRSASPPWGTRSTCLKHVDQHLRRHLKLGARYYNPTTARFTQPDPSGKEANTYNYASCNPVNSTDPTGTQSICWWADEGAKGVAAWGGLLAGIGGVVTVFQPEVGIPIAAGGGFDIGLGGAEVWGVSLFCS